MEGKKNRTLVIGLDCAPPSLVFERYASILPHLSALRSRGQWGKLRSCLPPITVPAWTCMSTGRDAGELGIYGFRLREDRSRALRVASARDVRFKRIWERAAEAGLDVAALFVPLTAPPSPTSGALVSGMLSEEGRATWPPSWEAALERRHGPLIHDVVGFRDGDLPRFFDALDAMRAQHFAIAKEVWVERAPDLLFMVELGTDRLHHAAWHHMDPTHPRYVKGNPWEARAKAYYTALDAQIGELLALTDESTHVIVASDHGAKAMRGGIAVNELLIAHGWLKLKRRPSEVTPLRECVDWSQTRAWAEGGYYARVFVNSRAEFADGIVSAEELPGAIDALATLFEAAAPNTEAHRPKEAFRAVRGNAPELLVVFDELNLRAIGTVGHPQVQLDSDGHDGCNHDWDGIYIAAGPRAPVGDVQRDAEIFDVHATLLRCLELAPPPNLLGRDLLRDHS